MPTRFNADIQDHVRDFIGNSRELATLADQSPLTVVALVTEYGPDKQRDIALSAALRGHIKEARGAIALPGWVDKLTPSALLDLSDLPNDATVNAIIANSIPNDAANHAAFLTAMRAIKRSAPAAGWGWLAAAINRSRMIPTEQQATLLGFYITCSCDRTLPASALIMDRWTPDMPLDAAARATTALIGWMVFVSLLGGRPLADTWRKGGTFGGFEFVPLTQVSDMIATARALNNCCYQLSHDLITGKYRLFALRQGGVIVALAELRPTEADGMLYVSQLRIHRNQPATADMRRACYRWLADTDELAIGMPGGPRSGMGSGSAIEMIVAPSELIDQKWRELTGAYNANYKAVKILPPTGTMSTLAQVLRRARELRRLSNRFFMPNI